jgi:hypothetical protein
MRTVSFSTLLADFAGKARVSRAALTAAEQEQFTADLNAAALWLWESETVTMALPDMLTGKTVTLATGAVIEAADIEDANFWSVWQSDPRLQTSATNLSFDRLRLAAIGQANGDVKVIGSNAGDTVYVFYKSIVPQWTVDAASNSTSYDIDDLIYCDGHVYRCLVDESSAGDLTDSTIWQEVTLPQSLQRIVVGRANYERMRLGANMPANASREEQETTRALELAFIGSEAQPHNKPWLYNQNSQQS